MLFGVDRRCFATGTAYLRVPQLLSQTGQKWPRSPIPVSPWRTYRAEVASPFVAGPMTSEPAPVGQLSQYATKSGS